MVKLTRRAGKDTVPVIVLAGFLGTGKTTILNHVLRAAVGARIAVIVNDFGATNIDAMLIAAQTDRKLELTNGCICCSMDGGELEETLNTALSVNPDVLIVEASGIAEPEDVARLIILSPNKKVGYGGLVYAVDAVNYQETVVKHRSITRHIEIADLVIVTKTEKVPKATVSNLVDELERITKAPIVPVKNGELAPELLFDIPERQEVQPLLLQQDEHHHHHLHDEYESVTFEASEPIDPTKFKAFMNQPPRGIYRVKGVAYFGVAGYEQKYIVQSVGGRWDMYAEEWSEGEVPCTTLVIIGADFDSSATLKTLAATVGEGGEMLDILRYSDLS